MGTVIDTEGHIAYLTLEIALENDMKTYSGGLGVLAGDVMRALADLDVPAVGVSLLNDLGYGKQTLDEDGTQIDGPDPWEPEEFLTKLDETVTVEIAGRDVTIAAWQYDVDSIHHDESAPVIFLDTNLPENDEGAQHFTRRLYGAGRGERYRVAQEIVLGIGGVRMLDELGYDVSTYHMNEGHASLLTLELLNEYDMDPEPVRNRCVFTTHTPLEAAHEEFDYWLLEELLGKDYIDWEAIRGTYSPEHVLHTTVLALNLTHYANAVAKRHQWVSHGMFPDYRDQIDVVTNGVHYPTWVGQHMQELFDHYLHGWQENPFKLRHAPLIWKDDLWEAHQDQKGELLDMIEEREGVEFDPEVLTIGFARRAVGYKRAYLLFRDVERLRRIVDEAGDLQVVFAGKAFPGDQSGIDMIRRIHDHIEELEDEIPIVYLEDYDMDIGLKMTAGVDVWLNNPRRPREACGTSGMKSAVNGVPQFSTLDGWWVEGHIEDETGWKIGPAPFTEESRGLDMREEDEVDAEDIYTTLEEAILPTYYEDREKWIDIMQNAITVHGPHYHARRMMLEYLTDAYR